MPCFGHDNTRGCEEAKARQATAAPAGPEEGREADDA